MRGIGFLACLTLLGLAGCSRPSEVERQNRRLRNGLRTAVSTKQSRELDNDEALIDKRHAEGQLSDRSYRTLKEIILKARSGNWGQAEDDLYRFRESHPFPR